MPSSFLVFLLLVFLYLGFPELPDETRRRTCRRQLWGDEEKRTVLLYFGTHIGLKKVPGKAEITRMLEKEPLLGTRSWRNVKDFIRNRIK